VVVHFTGKGRFVLKIRDTESAFTFGIVVKEVVLEGSDFEKRE